MPNVLVGRGVPLGTAHWSARRTRLGSACPGGSVCTGGLTSAAGRGVHGRTSAGPSGKAGAAGAALTGQHRVPNRRDAPQSARRTLSGTAPPPGPAHAAEPGVPPGASGEGGLPLLRRARSDVDPAYPGLLVGHGVPARRGVHGRTRRVSASWRARSARR
ncbi:hypothetical protein [Spirillospora sp. NPDC048819]|uniref:hypothetical protein n=1 Tax=Spirillospora sp. NPDC048819 TaxID=3155268 RepID=UPI0033D90F64